MIVQAKAFTRFQFTLLVSYLALLSWSASAPHDRFTWWLEVTPALLASVILVVTFRRFQFTPLAYTLIWLHAAILLVGGHYTYSEVPLFNWLRDTLHLSRNHYDRLGHVAQGFFPAIVIREILIRCSPLRPGKWVIFLTCCVCLSISASYELLEWAVALMTGQKADAFLGTQGDVWDTQWDMCLALIGSILSQLILARIHDTQLLAVCPRISQCSKGDFGI